MALAASWASAGAVGGVQGDGVQVAGPAPAATEAIRVPTWTELETDTTSRMNSDISMIPNRTSMSSGVSRAASTAAAPRWSRRRRAERARAGEERYREYFTLVPGNVYAAGDVVTVDADGYYTFLGRSDDVLNVAGHRIGTADVESAFVSHKSVAEAAVVGVPDPIKGESIKAFVILRAGQVANEDLKDALIAHVRRELGAIATPSELNFVEKLPKTRSGKILRRVLKAQALGIDPGDISTIEE